MAQQIMRNGEIHYFPDDASLDEINNALQNNHESSFQTNKGNNLLSTAANNPITNSILGAGDALRNQISNTLNLAPGINIDSAKSGQGTAYNLGNIAGNIGGFVGGGEGAELARGASESLPYLGKAASYLGKQGLPESLKRILGSSAFGAATSNPEERGEGGLIGGGLQAGFEAIPGIGSTFKYFEPKGLSEQIANNMSKVGLNLEDVLGSVTGKIKNSYENVREKSADLYNNIFHSNIDLRRPNSRIVEPVKIGEAKLFETKGPLSHLETNNPKTTYSNPYGENDTAQYIKESESYKDNNLDRLRRSYQLTPTFNRAHKLQSELGMEIGSLNRRGSIQGLDNSEKNLLARYIKDRKLLRSDIKNGLDSLAPDFGKNYESATKWHKSNVIPYENDTKLWDIASGKNKNTSVSSIKNIFAHPELNKDIQTVIGHLPKDIKDQIAYLGLEIPEDQLNASNLLKSRPKLEKSGLRSYLSDEIQKSLSELKIKNTGRNVINTLTSGLGGLGLGALTGSPALEVIGALAGGASGGKFGQQATELASHYLPTEAVSNVLKKYGKAIYKPATKGVVGASASRKG